MRVRSNFDRLSHTVKQTQYVVITKANNQVVLPPTITIKSSLNVNKLESLGYRAAYLGFKQEKWGFGFFWTVGFLECKTGFPSYTNQVSLSLPLSHTLAINHRETIGFL